MDVTTYADYVKSCRKVGSLRRAQCSPAFEVLLNTPCLTCLPGSLCWLSQVGGILEELGIGQGHRVASFAWNK